MKRTKNIEYFIKLANARIAAACESKKDWKMILNFSKNYLDGIGIKYNTCYAYFEDGETIECDFLSPKKDLFIIFK